MMKMITETTYERNENDSIVKETTIETFEGLELGRGCDVHYCEGVPVDEVEELIDGELEVTEVHEMGLLDYIMAGAGIASIVASCVAIYKALKK